MKSKKNIVHYWGGCPSFMTSKWLSYLMLINECNSRGWSNWLILSNKPEDASLIEPFIEAGCTIIYQPRSKGNFDIVSVFRNFKLLRKIKCDIFHCYNDHTSPIIAATLARVPERFWSKLAMSSYYEKGIKPKGTQRLMLSTYITCLFSKRVLAITDIANKEICQQVGFDHKVDTVYAPVSLERFFNAKNSKIRPEFSFKESDIVVTAVGHSVEVKGWDIAIQSFVQVLSKFPDAKLLLVGGWTSHVFHKKLQDMIIEFGLEKNIYFTGIRTDIPEILKESDIFILPSRSEGMGAALVEAMAVGLPCIATDTGGIPEVINNEDNGLLFKRECPDELANKIIKLISSPQLRKELSEAAKVNLQKFSLENYVNRIIAYYSYTPK